MRDGLSFLVSALVVAATQANAGVVVTTTQTELDSKKTTTSMVYVDTDRLKIATPDNILIFRGDRNLLWVVDPQRRSYTELTGESVQQMASQMSGAMAAARARMQEELAKMPPDRRAQLEAMLASRGGLAGLAGPAPRAPQVNYVKAGGSKSVGAWRCDLYDRNVDGKKDQDVCIAPISSANLSAGDLQVFERFETFMAPMTARSPVQQYDVFKWSAMNKALGFQGVPLDTVMYSGGKPDRQLTVNKLDRTAIPANTYDLPAGLTKRELPGLGALGAPR